MPKKKEDREAEIDKIGDEVMCRIAALLPDRTHGVYAYDPKITLYKKENES